MPRQILILLILLLTVPVNGEAFDRYKRVTKYDQYFTKYSKRFFGPGVDWQLFKAQAVAESHLDPEAESRVGAQGVMQIMPRTFAEIKSKNRAIAGSVQQPRWNIAAGIWYDRALWKTWKEERPLQDRRNFMFGSYNAGQRNIINAQREAVKEGLNPNSWESIEKVLQKVTGKRSKETIGYVRKIAVVHDAIK